MKMAVLYCKNWSSGTLYMCDEYVYGYVWMRGLTAIPLVSISSIFFTCFLILFCLSDRAGNSICKIWELNSFKKMTIQLVCGKILPQMSLVLTFWILHLSKWVFDTAHTVAQCSYSTLKQMNCQNSSWISNT